MPFWTKLIQAIFQKLEPLPSNQYSPKKQPKSPIFYRARNDQAPVKHSSLPCHIKNPSSIRPALPRYHSPRQRKNAQKPAIYRHQNRQQSAPQGLPCKDLTHIDKTLSRKTFHAMPRACRIHHRPLNLHRWW